MKFTMIYEPAPAITISILPKMPQIIRARHSGNYIANYWLWRLVRITRSIPTLT